MTNYTTISNSEVDQDSPVTQTLMSALRDNPIAITEGSAGAPKIQTNAIADNAVTENKIANYVVTTNKIANNAVTTNKIVNNAVTENKIANYVVTTNKIANTAVTLSKLNRAQRSFSGSINPSTSTGFALADNYAFSPIFTASSDQVTLSFRAGDDGYTIQNSSASARTYSLYWWYLSA